MHRSFDPSPIIYQAMHCWLVIVWKIDYLSAQNLFWLLSHFRNVTTVIIYVTATHYTSNFLHFWLLHLEWYTYTLIFFLPECMSIVVHFVKLAIEASNKLKVDDLELIIEIESKPKILNLFTPCMY